MGRLSKADEQVISQSSVASCVSSPGYVDHVRSAEYVRSADLLFLPLHERQDGKRASIVPGKAYEYLASGNPVLGALPAGDARDYLKAAGNVFLAEPSDVDALVEGINHHFEQWKEGAISYSRDSGALEAFERRTLTVKLAGFLNEVAKAGVVK